MANALYPKFKEGLLQGSFNLISQTVKAMLVKSGYTYSSSHQYLSSVAAYDNGRSSGLTNKTVTNGVFDADDVQITATSTAQVVAVVLYVDTGNDNTSPLIAYLDNIQGLPFMIAVNGVVRIVWDNSQYKIFSL